MSKTFLLFSLPHLKTFRLFNGLRRASKRTDSRAENQIPSGDTFFINRRIGEIRRVEFRIKGHCPSGKVYVPAARVPKPDDDSRHAPFAGFSSPALSSAPSLEILTAPVNTEATIAVSHSRMAECVNGPSPESL